MVPGQAGPEGAHGFDERRPAAALAGVASSVWVQRVAAATTPYPHRTVPNGSVELRCRIGSALHVVGPLTRPLVDVLEPGTTIVGIRFSPGAVSGLLGLPTSELADQVIEARELLGAAAGVLEEQVAASPTPTAALDLLQRHVAGRLQDAAEPDPLVTEAVQRLMPWQGGDVGSLRSTLCISERQLRRRFETSVGFGPKVLHRVLRFQGFLAMAQQALAQGRKPTSDGLAILAAETGYADQSHLTRESVRLSGNTPAVFLGEVGRQCGCGHNHAVSYEPMLVPRTTAA
jgi:AraC-like DNA-binding protein